MPEINYISSAVKFTLLDFKSQCFLLWRFMCSNKSCHFCMLYVLFLSEAAEAINHNTPVWKEAELTFGSGERPIQMSGQVDIYHNRATTLAMLHLTKWKTHLVLHCTDMRVVSGIWWYLLAKKVNQSISQNLKRFLSMEDYTSCISQRPFLLKVVRSEACFTVLLFGVPMENIPSLATSHKKKKLLIRQ